MLAVNVTPASGESVVLYKETLNSSDLQVGMDFH
jgi:hypothetical protein